MKQVKQEKYKELIKKYKSDINEKSFALRSSMVKYLTEQDKKLRTVLDDIYESDPKLWLQTIIRLQKDNIPAAMEYDVDGEFKQPNVFIGVFDPNQDKIDMTMKKYGKQEESSEEEE